MGRIGSTTSMRAREMHCVLAGWQRSGLPPHEFGQRRGIPPSTLSWWRQVFRRAGEEKLNRAPPENVVVFTEVRQPAKVPGTASVLEIVLHSGHTAGADTDMLQRLLQVLQTTC